MIDDTKRKRVSGEIINLPSQNGHIITCDDIAAHGAEEAIIGAVLREPLVFSSTSEVLQPGDFYTLFYGYCWYAFEQILNRSEEIDLVTLADEMTRQGRWHDGDMQRIADLAANAPSASNAEAYARQVREAATRIRGLAASDRLRALMLDRAMPLEKVIDECNRALFEATDQRVYDDDTSIAAVMQDYHTQLEEALEGGLSPGLPTGYRVLDRLHGGAARGEVVVVGGGEAMGKTTFMLNIVRNAAMLGLRIAIFTLEMMRKEIGLNFSAMEASIPKATLKNFSLDPMQWSRFVRASGQIAGWGIDIIDEYPSLTPIQLRRKLRKLRMQRGIDIVLVDGLWLMEDSDPKVTDRPRAVGNIMRDIVQIARDFNVALYITHQYNGDAWGRSKDDKRPKLHDFAESAGVRRNAQVIWGLYRDNYYGIESVSNVTELHILKDRNGSGAQGQVVDFTFDSNRTLFEEIG